MGVITVCDIDYGQIYGPFPSNLTSVDVTYIIGMLTTDETSHGPVLQVCLNNKSINVFSCLSFL